MDSGQSTTSPTDNATTYANMTTNKMPSTIQHKKSAIITLEHPKQEIQLYSAITRTTKIKPHAIVQINHEQPYHYQVTFVDEKQYLQCLPQTIQLKEQSIKFSPLAATRLQISVLKVDPELDDKEVDFAFIKYGKVITKTQKLFKNITESEKIHVGNRILTIELADPNKLPPNSMFLTAGMQSQILYTLPGSSKTNQALAYEEREKRREEKRKAEKAEQERIEREEQRASAETAVVDREGLKSPSVRPSATTQPPEKDIDAAAEVITEKSCDRCNFDLSPAFIHTECKTQLEPNSITDLIPDRSCSNGLVVFQDCLTKYSSDKDAKAAADLFKFALARCHEQYFDSIIKTLGLSEKLSPPNLAQIILLSAIQQVTGNNPDILDTNTLDAVHHHKNLTKAINDQKLRKVKVNFNSTNELCKVILDACVTKINSKTLDM